MGVAKDTTTSPDTQTDSAESESASRHHKQQQLLDLRPAASSVVSEQVLQMCHAQNSDSSSSSAAASPQRADHSTKSGGVGGGMVDGAVHLPPRYKLSKKKRNTTNAERIEDSKRDADADNEDPAKDKTHNARIDIQINGKSYTNGDTPVSMDESCPISDSPQQREKDLSIALQWLRQEFQSLREQDRQLARQFISLRSAIRHLQITSSAPSNGAGHLSRNTSFSSAEDLAWYMNSSSASSLEQATGSGGVDIGGRPSGSALREDDYAGDFRPRTQSLLEPRATSSAAHSPMLAVRRFGRTISKECF